MIEHEIENATTEGIWCYLQGALKDGTFSRHHRTHRIGQLERSWLELLRRALERNGYKSWIYREGSEREFWILETSAPLLSTRFDARPLIGTPAGIDYARGYFDAEGGMPRDPRARLYLQLTQKDRFELLTLKRILESWGIACGEVHNPSAAVDPDYWRFYVSASAQTRFLRLVSSWHPRKRALIEQRLLPLQSPSHR